MLENLKVFSFVDDVTMNGAYSMELCVRAPIKPPMKEMGPHWVFKEGFTQTYPPPSAEWDFKLDQLRVMAKVMAQMSRSLQKVYDSEIGKLAQDK